MTNPYRAMCAELLTEYEDSFTTSEPSDDPLVQRARALLAQPVAEGPTDEELDELFTEIDQGGECLSWRAYARAVLARWGRPAAAPVPEPGEVAELVKWLHRRAAEVQAENCTTIYSPHLRRVADLLAQRYPAPVPVSERLPGPEDCDEQGRCWAWNPEAIWWELFRAKFLALNAGDPYTHWLPAHALPTPEAND